jgi:aspartate-semialdehyde dehydrogenase
MTVTVGRIRSCPVHDIRLMVLAHNLERGAAGAALANAELCAARGWIPGVESVREGAA